MKSIKEIRRVNLQKCVDEAGSPKNFLQRYGHLYGAEGKLSASYLSQLLSGTTAIGEGATRKFEAALGKTAHWFDVDRDANPELPLEAPIVQWPFSVDISVFMALPAQEREKVDDFLSYTVEKWHKAAQVKSKKSA